MPGLIALSTSGSCLNEKWLHFAARQRHLRARCNSALLGRDLGGGGGIGELVKDHNAAERGQVEAQQLSLRARTNHHSSAIPLWGNGLLRTVSWWAPWRGSLDGMQGVRHSVHRLHSLEAHPDSLGGQLTASEDQGRSSWSTTFAQRLAILLIATIGADRLLSIGCGRHAPPSRLSRRWARPLRPPQDRPAASPRGFGKSAIASTTATMT
jgi:hypothetical protein